MALTPQERIERINDFRERFNKILGEIGFEAPAYVLNQSVGGWRRNTVQTTVDSLLPQHHQFAKIPYRDIPFDAFKNLEDQALRTCVAEYQSPKNVPEGTLRMIKKTDKDTGLKSNYFVGRDCFVKLSNFGCETQITGGYRPGRSGRIRNPDNSPGWFRR